LKAPKQQPGEHEEPDNNSTHERMPERVTDRAQGKAAKGQQKEGEAPRNPGIIFTQAEIDALLANSKDPDQ